MPRVLLVEDEALIRMLATDYLEDAGYTVEPAVSAKDAMDKVQSVGGRIDAAVIDVGLPDRKGDALAIDLRAAYPALPIIMASGYGETSVRKSVGDDGRIAILTKPYTQEQLIALLRAL